MPPTKPLAAQYRDYASECLLKASEASDPKAKAELEELARQWTRLAEHRERLDVGGGGTGDG